MWRHHNSLYDVTKGGTNYIQGCLKNEQEAKHLKKGRSAANTRLIMLSETTLGSRVTVRLVEMKENVPENVPAS